MLARRVKELERDRDQNREWMVCNKKGTYKWHEKVPEKNRMKMPEPKEVEWSDAGKLDEEKEDEDDDQSGNPEL